MPTPLCAAYSADPIGLEFDYLPLRLLSLSMIWTARLGRRTGGGPRATDENSAR